MVMGGCDIRHGYQFRGDFHAGNDFKSSGIRHSNKFVCPQMMLLSLS